MTVGLEPEEERILVVGSPVLPSFPPLPPFPFSLSSLFFRVKVLTIAF